eukprot:TRINITY_DN564_c0_g1_i2.p1 TRINITY_DN564_c0_g1~~TRINITY_DN564_c0_g1_i2.p1  ORF type:complete len:843 (+),score=314.22 TRINITY_DN564_c0_g1_i2:374-2902(+)
MVADSAPASPDGGARGVTVPLTDAMEPGRRAEPAASAPANGVGATTPATPADAALTGGPDADERASAVSSSWRLTAAGLRRRLVGGPAAAAAAPPPGDGGAGVEGGAAPAAAANAKANASGDGGSSGGTAGTTQANGAKSKADAAKSGNAKDTEKRDEEEEKELGVTALQALQVAWPWMLPRSARMRALVLLSILCHVLARLCRFIRPLLLKYAMDGMSQLLLTDGGGGGRGGGGGGIGTCAAIDGAAALAATNATAGASAPAAALFFGRWAAPLGVYRRPLAATVSYISADYASGLLSYGHHLAWKRAQQGMLFQLQVDTFAHLHSLSLSWHLKRNTGRVMHIFYRGVGAAMDLFRVVSFNVAPMLLEFVLTVGTLGRLGSGSLSALALGSVVVYAGVSALMTRVQMRLGEKRSKAAEREAGRAIDSLLNYENVKVFGTEAVETRRYRDQLRKENERSDRSSLTGAILSNLQSFVRSVCVVAGLIMAGRRVAAGDMSVADFVAVDTYLRNIFYPFTYAGYFVSDVASMFLSLRKLVDLHQQRPSVVDAPGATKLVLRPSADGACRGGEVAFDNVSFTYGDDSVDGIHGVSFTVRAGGTTAIVGPSGSGKTTLVRLALRLFDVTGGRITIDGQDVAKVTQQSLRDAIGLVSQDTTLLRDSVRANIAYARNGGEGVSDADVTDAAAVAQLTAWLGRLPKGLDTVCGERGVRLSGGERQRVGIARVVLRRPAVLLLDESSSSLDSETERSMQEALRVASRGATTIIIAHRLSTAMDADDILVLDEGRVVERGNHAALVGRDGGKYRRMWELQHGGRLAGEDAEKVDRSGVGEADTKPVGVPPAP